MNLSEYHLIKTLTKKVGEPSIAIMIAEDALNLGKRIFNIENNIKRKEKQISVIQRDLDNMEEEDICLSYLTSYCPHCNVHHYQEWEGEIGEQAIKDARRIANDRIKMFEEQMFEYMEQYESIMGESYNIEYIVSELVDKLINEVMVSSENHQYNRIKYWFNNNEEQEKNVLVPTIKRLLDDCERTPTQIKKFQVATCIMCVISNSPTFLNNHERFKNTVLDKLNELSFQIDNLIIDTSEYYRYVEKIRCF